MLEVDRYEGSIRIRGLIGVGEQAKATRAHEAFFINGRSVRCPLLSQALESVCRERVTIGMYPMCALHLTLSPSSVDVNVHPNKLEVRFRDEAGDARRRGGHAPRGPSGRLDAAPQSGKTRRHRTCAHGRTGAASGWKREHTKKTEVSNATTEVLNQKTEVQNKRTEVLNDKKGIWTRFRRADFR